MLSGMPVSPSSERSRFSSGKPSVGRIVFENEGSASCCAETREKGEIRAVESTAAAASERSAARRDRRRFRICIRFELLLDAYIVVTTTTTTSQYGSVAAKHRSPTSPLSPRLTMVSRGSSEVLGRPALAARG